MSLGIIADPSCRTCMWAHCTISSTMEQWVLSQTPHAYLYLPSSRSTIALVCQRPVSSAKGSGIFFVRQVISCTVSLLDISRALVLLWLLLAVDKDCELTASWALRHLSIMLWMSSGLYWRQRSVEALRWYLDTFCLSQILFLLGIVDHSTWSTPLWEVS